MTTSVASLWLLGFVSCGALSWGELVAGAVGFLSRSMFCRMLPASGAAYTMDDRTRPAKDNSVLFCEFCDFNFFSHPLFGIYERHLDRL